MAIATQKANLFELSCGDTRVTYSTSSFAGPPQFGYSDPDVHRSFSGDEIQTLDSALGTEVTVTLETVPDLHTITFTLLLPSFKLPKGKESKFETLGIKTVNHTTIAGPPVGPAQTYAAITLHGVAKSVVF